MNIAGTTDNAIRLQRCRLGYTVLMLSPPSIPRSDTRILVVADTHLPASRADQITTILGRHLEAADVIVHAGDITDVAVLDLLAEWAPVHAVLGNNDHGLDLPETVQLEIAGVTISVVHDSGAAGGRGPRLARWFPDADVVVFGHSHLPWHVEHVEARRQIHFNPGSATQRRRAPSRTIGWIEIGDDARPRCHHVDV